MATIATIMICSNCGGRLTPDQPRIEDPTHICHDCGATWDETNGWVEVGNLLIPYQNAMIKYRRQRRAVR